MRHHDYNPDFHFIMQPENFNKYTDKQVLQYCLGAALYMPATKDFARVVVNKAMRGLTSMVMCFEDAIKEEDLPKAEENAVNFLRTIHKAKESGALSVDDIPLIFFRVRSPEHFISISRKLELLHLQVLTGFVFPKFNSSNGNAYFEQLSTLSEKHGEVLYGMPILEGREVAFAETRIDELLKVKRIIDSYRKFALNIRVGATDFSSNFGVRRGIDYTIYDIVTVRECLHSILNIFSRDNDYVISGPVWEYFVATKSMKFSETNEEGAHSLFKRNRIINDAIDGLLREVTLDKANGFVGKTIIHPSHLEYVNAMQAVTEEEFNDAIQILGTSGGVIKSNNANKMNEIKPHRSWAHKVHMRSKAYGVIKDETAYAELFGFSRYDAVRRMSQ